MKPAERVLDCPQCGGKMRLKPSRYGLFYSCENWKRTGCDSTVGAHPDGAPLGFVADKETKRLRVQAHDAFDGFWKARKMKRGTAYKWLQHSMNLTVDQAHIGMFDADQCRALILLTTGAKQ